MKRIVLGTLLALPMAVSAANTGTSAAGEESAWAQYFRDLQAALFPSESLEANERGEATTDGGNTPGGCGFGTDNSWRQDHECEEK